MVKQLWITVTGLVMTMYYSHQVSTDKKLSTAVPFTQRNVHERSTTGNIKGCPSTCVCLADQHIQHISITDCTKDPKDNLTVFIQSYPNLTSLRISHALLSIVPCDLTNLIHLRSLDLSDNMIKSVSCDLSTLNQLTNLNLSFCLLDAFPCNLSSLAQLATLDLSMNPDIVSMPCDLSTLEHLTSIKLKACDLKTFPCKLLSLKQLTVLDLSMNPIESIQCDLSTLDHLTNLKLSASGLYFFPCELLSLKQLTTLDFSWNMIQSVPCNLSNLTHLTELRLDGNALSIFPCTLSGLTQLRSLRLSSNQIRLAPCDFSNLRRLTHLYLRENALDTFPCNLLDLPQLTYLDLSANRINSIQCDLSNMTQLSSLLLSRNNLSSFPCKLSTLLNLATLAIHSNHMDSVPCNLSNLTLLNHLVLNGNTFNTFPCALSTLIQLFYLDVSQNQIESLTCDLSNLTRLAHLDFSQNQLKSLPCGLSNLMNLTNLYLDRNQIDSVKCDLSHLTSLTTLNLSMNQIMAMPCDLSNLTNLSILGLSRNHLRRVPCDLPKLIKLNTLDLSGNQIELVPNDISNLTNLISLDLSTNHISILDSWPISLAIKHTNGTNIQINMDQNHLSQFTNFAQAPITLCTTIDKPFISLMNNTISHVMDILIGWNLKISTSEQLHKCLNILLPILQWNPLTCDCVDYNVYGYMQSRNVSYEHLECYKPLSLRGQNPAKIRQEKFVCENVKSCPVGCHCLTSPFHQSVNITCANYSETTLPKTVPSLPNNEFLHGQFLYDLDFYDGHLRNLPKRQYLTKVNVAKFSNNAISEISMDVLLALQNVSILNLNGNKLRKLPDDITNVRLNNVQEIRLGLNPWICDCRIIGTKNWMIKYSNVIKDKHTIYCSSPSHLKKKPILYTNDSVFCPGKPNRLSITIIVCSGTIILLLCVLLILSRIRARLRYRRIILQMDQDDDEMEYDVFVSYADEDEEYVLEYLIPELETHFFKVCFHRVHFHGGKTIIENIHECINKSKRTLVFFSNSFNNSKFAMYEFSEALNKDVREGTSRLITIKDTDLDIDSLDDSTKAYFQKRTFIEKEANRFWDNLLHSLPKNPLGN